ncbi:MAG: flavin monoamine oxidase family protein [Mycobacterium sp.]
MARPDVDVVVVGAGIAGLVAARNLRRSGHEVAVLEARNRVGGRMLNATLPDGAPIELGGQWVGPGQTEVLDLIAELGLSLFPTYAEGRHVLGLDGRLVTCTRRIPRLNPVVLADIGYGSWRLGCLTRSLPNPVPRSTIARRRWMLRPCNLGPASSAHPRQQGVLAPHRPGGLCRRTRRPLCLVGRCLSRRQTQGLDTLMTIHSGALQGRIVGGSRQVDLRLAAQLGNRVRLNCPVTEVSWDYNSVRAGVKCGTSALS